MNSILTAIEKSKEDKSFYKRLSSLISIEEEEIDYFIEQFSLFQLLSKDVNTKYVNYFNSIDIFLYELKQKHKKETFYKCISIFMKEQTKGNIIFCDLRNNTIIKIYNDFFKSFQDIDLYQYEIINETGINNIETEEYTNECNDLLTVFFKYVNKNIKSVDIPNEIPLIQRNVEYVHKLVYDDVDYRSVLNYSTKYPNRIREIEINDSIESNVYKIIKLNKNSLINIPFFNVELINKMPKLTKIKFVQPPPKEIPNIDYKRITAIEIILPKINSLEQRKEYIKLYLSYIDLCPNLDSLSFFSGKYVPYNSISIIFLILMNMKSNKLKSIRGFSQIVDRGTDFGPIIEKFPHLESIHFYKNRCNQVFDCERCDVIEPVSNGCLLSPLDYSNLSKLIRNYLNSDLDRTISVSVYNYNLLIYLSDKPDIYLRIKHISKRETVINQYNNTFSYIPIYVIEDRINLLFILYKLNKIGILYLETIKDSQYELERKYNLNLIEECSQCMPPEQFFFNFKMLLSVIAKVKPDILYINSSDYNEIIEEIVTLNVTPKIIDNSNEVIYLKDINEYKVFKFKNIYE